MNLLYLVNYLTFSILLALFVLELGIAVLSVIKYNAYKSLIKRNFKYLWAVVGTFAVFYLVNFESTYPKLIFHVATLYEAPIFIAAILILVKNTFAAYSEHFIEEPKGKIFNKIYAIATILSAVFVVGIVTSVGSGIAVNLGTNQLSLGKMIFNPFNIMVLAGLLIISIFLAYGFENPETKKQSWLILAGIALLAVSSAIYMNYAMQNLINYIWIAVVEVLFIAFTVFSLLTGKKYAGTVTASLLASLVLSLGILQYPYAFGKGINLLNELNASKAMGTAIISVAFIGFALLFSVLMILKWIGKKK